MTCTEYLLFKVNNTNKKVIHTYTYTPICVSFISLRTIRGTIGCVSFGGRGLGSLYFAFCFSVFEIAKLHLLLFFFNKWGVFISKYYEITHVKSLEWYYIDILI